MKKSDKKEVKIKVKCFSCGLEKWLTGEQCRQMPFCDKCFMPMIAQVVKAK